MTIVKADPDGPAGRPGSGFRITYRWQAAPMDKDYTVFVHVVDDEGRIALQDDHQPATPTSKWNGLVTYTRTVPLEQWKVKDKRTVDVALAEGKYAILAGLYDKEGGRRVSLNPGPGVAVVDEGGYRIGMLTVDAQAPIPGPGERTLDLTGYHVTFDEEFNDLSVSAWGPAGPGGTRWIAHTPWRGDFGDARFTDPRPGFPFTIHDGLLRIEAREEDGRWRSGLLSAVDPNGNGFKQQYGYFECRAKFPKGPGTWPAFWLMGTRSLNRMPGNTGPRVNPEVDGVELHREPTPECVKTPLFPLVNLALGPGWPTDKTPNPSYMYVDYIKVRQEDAS